MTHARFAPSSAEQWGNCSQYTHASRGRYGRPNERTRLGDAAHWGAQCGNEALKAGWPLDLRTFIGRVAPNGCVFDDECAEGAQLFVDDVAALVPESERVRLNVEQRVYMHDLHPQNDGTPDLWWVDFTRLQIVIWDYKHGHRGVSAIDNLQTVDYLRGVCNALQLNGLDEQNFTFQIRIVQPFSYHSGGPIRKWSGRLSDLRAIWNRLSQKMHEADTNPSYTTGPWCRDCEACGVCPANRAKHYNLIEVCHDATPLDQMSPEDLAAEREVLRQGAKTLQARLDDINLMLEESAKSGGGTGGLVLQSGTPRTVWADDAPYPVIYSIGEMFGVDIRQDKPLTVRQATQAVPKDKRAAFGASIKSLTTQKPGAMELVEPEQSRVARAFQPKKED